MATVVLGTVGKDRKPLWHPRFLEFTRHYGYEPYLCKVADPDRKGKDERVFLYLERDFIRGSEFHSFDDLNRKVRLWLDEVANRRVHGTTRRVPQEAWEEERHFLIPLPESPYPAYDEQLRKVGPDSVISVRGTPYTVPAKLAQTEDDKPGGCPVTAPWRSKPARDVLARLGDCHFKSNLGQRAKLSRRVCEVSST